MEYKSVTDHDRRRLQDGAESSIIVIEFENGMRRNSGTTYETVMVYVAWRGMASEEVDALMESVPGRTGGSCEGVDGGNESKGRRCEKWLRKGE